LKTETPPTTIAACIAMMGFRWSRSTFTALALSFHQLSRKGISSFVLSRRSRYIASPIIMTRHSHHALASTKPKKAGKGVATLPGSGTSAKETDATEQVPLYRSQGILAVAKPADWTSNDVVSYLRGALEREARRRGARPARVGSRRNRGRAVRVGHGGTLDPLATGVLVIGVGRGTKELQSYLAGPKRYTVEGEFGFETNTLDMEGNVTKRGDAKHITQQALQDVLPQFVGKIQQVPPIFSAIRKDGKKYYQHARQGKVADDMDIQPREVEILSINLLDCQLPKFTLDVSCGSGTYIRALIRDIGHALDSFATTTRLERTQQGQFSLDDALPKDDWSAESIYNSIDRVNAKRETEK
jgi:tRNA pseudouridine55 synthase